MGHSDNFSASKLLHVLPRFACLLACSSGRSDDLPQSPASTFSDWPRWRLLEGGKEGAKANTHPRALHVCRDSSGWPDHVCRRSVSRSHRQSIGWCPCSCQHHGTSAARRPCWPRHGAGRLRLFTGGFPQHRRVALQAVLVPIHHVVVTHRAAPFLRIPQ